MPRGNQLSRQWRLLQLLDAPAGVTVEDAARDLDCVVRTIWRDLRVLQDAGFPIYDEAQAKALATEKGWVVKPDGDHWRRVVPSPRPLRIFELRPIRWLLDHNVVVICAGGGGIPTMYQPDGERHLVGVEAVIDKDLASSLLARDLEADLFIMATDVDGVYRDWGTPDQARIDRVTPDELRDHGFPAGSMGPKVDAAAEFVASTGQRSVIGALSDIDGMVAGTAGTNVTAS